MSLAFEEIFETIRMIGMEHLDIRTTTLGVSLLDCRAESDRETARKVYEKVVGLGARLVPAAGEIEAEYGIPIVNKRVAVTPVAELGLADPLPVAQALDKAAKEIGIDFLGGYSALVQKGFTAHDRALIDSLPEALAVTERLCGSVAVASTRAGINIDACYMLGRMLKALAQRTAERGGVGCAKFCAFANAVDDNPFMAGAFYGLGEGECGLSVGISGPGVVNAVVKGLPGVDLQTLADEIRRTAYKITRIGELVGRKVSEKLGVPFNIIDLSLAPTPAPGDSIGEILEGIGLERTGAPGSTAALMLLTDAVKRGGAMATSHTGGLSGAFIPVSEDGAMAAAAAEGALSVEKLEALTAVCCVGLDMIILPGDTSAETLAGIIADESAIGVMNHKTTACRLIPAPGKNPGDTVDFGGLLGSGPVMPVNRYRCDRLMQRGGRIPAPLQGLKN
ncbi:MAG: PFL family protein [Planctomycetota bacterium]|nr:PFL family protein [Planctomycetota bacterium]